MVGADSYTLHPVYKILNTRERNTILSKDLIKYEFESLTRPIGYSILIETKKSSEETSVVI